MKSLVLASALLLSLNTFAKGDPAAKADHGDHTLEVCSTVDSKVCAHIGHMEKMTAKNESSFLVHIMSAKPVSNMKLELWMPEHNHGTTTPPVVTPEKENKFKVTKANFIMAGNWVVRVNFDIDKTAHKLEIPLTIPK